MARLFTNIPIMELVSDAATTAWAAAVVSNGGTVSAGRKSLVDALIVGLKNDGVWTKLDRLWILAAEDEPSALTDMVALDLATTVNSPSFTADDGYLGNGSSNYISSTYNPTTDATNYALNAATFGAWMFTPDYAFPAVALGAVDGSNFIIQILGAGGSSFQLTVNASGGTVNISGAAGLFHGVRTSSTEINFYRNGSGKQTNSSSSSGTIPNLTQFILCRNNNGPAGEFSVNRLSAAFYGGSMDDTDVSNFYDRMRNYMTAVGVP
jgi:hypothetical protein